MSSTSLAFEFPSSTSIVPFPTSSAPAWMRGQFPSSLTLSNDRLTEGLIADVPFYSVGVLAIGVATFFFVMNRMQKYIFNTLLATFLVFLSAILDLGQLITISWGVFTGTVFPLRIARELGYAVSFGLRFFFFWQFVAMPPRGEIPVLPTPGRGPDDKAPFVLGDEFHSGSWGRWGLVGILAKYTLMIGTITIGVTQAIWRLGFAFGLIRFTSVYQADAVIQIIMSALLLLKLAGNSYISPLMPRWKSVRDYLPVVAAISVGLGIAIGNLICMRFSESPLGRFFQAIELYILILYVLIAAFYKAPPRSSMIVGTPIRQRPRGNSSFVGLGINIGSPMRASAFRVTPPNVSTPQVPARPELEAPYLYDVPTQQSQSDDGRQLSTAERVTTWIQNRLSGRPSGLEQRLSRQDIESGRSSHFNTGEKKKGSAGSEASSMRPINESEGSRGVMYANDLTPPTDTATVVNHTPQFSRVPGPSELSSSKPNESPMALTPFYAAEAGLTGPRGASSMPTAYSSFVSGAFSPVIAAPLAPVNPLNIRTLPNNPRLRPGEELPSPPPAPLVAPVPVPTPTRIPSPVPSESPSGTSFRITREYGYSSSPLAPPPETMPNPRQQQANSGDESPIYGLEGIIQSLGGDLLPDEELRSQQESMTERDGAAYSPGAASFLKKQVDIERSVADLNRFMQGRSPIDTRPLYAHSDGTITSYLSTGQESTSLRSDFTLGNFPSPPSAILDYSGFPRRNSVARPGEIDLDDIRFTLTPPRMPAAVNGRQVSFPSTTRGSDIFQPRLGVAETPNRTQWDVTSFIGGSELMSPRSATIARPDSQGRPLSYARNRLPRDTVDGQRLSMVIEALSNGGSTSDSPDEDEGSVRGARRIDVRRTSSLTQARIVEGPLSAAASPVNSTTLQSVTERPLLMPTPAERLAAFRAQPPRKVTLPSSPRPAYRANSPPAREPSPLGKPTTMALEPEAQPVLQPEPTIYVAQAQPSGSQTQQPAFSQPTVPSPAARSNNTLSPPRGLRNLRISSPLEQSQNRSALRTGAFERPRPAPLVIANSNNASSRIRATQNPGDTSV
ncbi:unnamed protein product [Rhizoctonia solani]|uniref:Transmembrane protein n=1 Tax=Rhizoctonia solani TaxID=456999 RepID=A0A8H3DT25_9AGAM|nr:unnamed protein product [Rhizoctonia solani]